MLSSFTSATNMALFTRPEWRINNSKTHPFPQLSKTLRNGNKILIFPILLSFADNNQRALEERDCSNKNKDRIHLGVK